IQLVQRVEVRRTKRALKLLWNLVLHHAPKVRKTLELVRKKRLNPTVQLNTASGCVFGHRTPVREQLPCDWVGEFDIGKCNGRSSTIVCSRSVRRPQRFQ